VRVEFSYRDLVALMAEWGACTSTTRPLCAGSIGMCRNTRSGGSAGRNRSVRPGGWMRPAFAPAQDGLPLSRGRQAGQNHRVAAPNRARNRCRNGPLFRKAVATCAPHCPRKITLDGNKQSPWGLRRLRREDHRAIKGRWRPMLGLKSYRTAAVTLAGIELAHRIRKRQFKFGPGRWICWSLKKQGDRALA
jgi:hypothetical protein